MEGTSQTSQNDDLDKKEDAAKPSRWLTVEYFLWTASLLTCYVFNFYFAYVKSEEMAKKIFVRGITEGWFFGRDMDDSDAQWSTWRENFPLLVVGSSAFLTGSYLCKREVCNYEGKLVDSLSLEWKHETYVALL